MQILSIVLEFCHLLAMQTLCSMLLLSYIQVMLKIMLA